MAGSTLYSINAARKRLGGISRDTIYGLLSSGRLASVVMGRRRFIPEAAMDEYVAASTTRVAPGARAASTAPTA